MSMDLKNAESANFLRSLSPGLVLLVALVSGGWLVSQASSRRPHTLHLPWDPHHDDHIVDAALWQDPLDATYRHHKSLLQLEASGGYPGAGKQGGRASTRQGTGDGGDTYAEEDVSPCAHHRADATAGVAGEVTDGATDGVAGEVTDGATDGVADESTDESPDTNSMTLVVHLHPGSFASNREKRIRSRVAVVRALAKRGYLPAAAHQLKYEEFEACLGEGMDGIEKPVHEYVVVPIEQFKIYCPPGHSEQGSDDSETQKTETQKTDPADGGEQEQDPPGDPENVALAKSAAGGGKHTSEVESDLPCHVSGNPIQTVDVIWLDSRYLKGATPIAWQSAIVAGLERHQRRTFANLRTIGPTSSDILHAVADELGYGAEEGPPGGSAQTVNPIPLHSPWATAHSVLDDMHRNQAHGTSAATNPAADDSTTDDATGKDAEARYRPEFRPAIGNDRDLVSVLVEELGRRVPRLMGLHDLSDLAEEGRSDRLKTLRWWFLTCLAKMDLIPRAEVPIQAKILVFVEWDTEYGREWARQINSAFDREASVTIVAYLRGLDGRAPGAQDSFVSIAGATDDAAFMGVYPTGTSDLEAIRRMTRKLDDDLRSSDENLFRRDEEYDAVGVFGSDVYDKLLLLDVMRAAYPSAVPFTSDLDARMFSQEHLDHSRNLVVVSHHLLDPDGRRFRESKVGLRVAEHASSAGKPVADGILPPFRGSYQTAVYLAALDALDHGRAASPQGADEPPCQPPVGRAWVHEVGRSGAVLMPKPGETDIDDRVRPLLATGTAVRISVVLLVLGMLLLSPIGGQAREWARSAGAVKGPLVAAGLIVGFALLYEIGERVYDGLVIEGEPVALFSGVSVFPAIALRLATMYLAATFILFMWVELRRCRRSAERRLFGWPDSAREPIAPREWHALFLAWRRDQALHRGGSRQAWKSGTEGHKKAAGVVRARRRFHATVRLAKRELAPWALVGWLLLQTLWLLRLGWWGLKSCATWTGSWFGRSSAAPLVMPMRPRRADPTATAERGAEDSAEGSRPPRTQESHDLMDHWRAFCVVGRLPRRVCWSFIIGISYWVAMTPYFVGWEGPGSPARGEYAFLVDRLTILASVLSFLGCVFFTVQAMYATVQLVRAIDRRDHEWPDELIDRRLKSSGRSKKSGKWGRESERRLLDVQLVEHVTGFIESLVYYPAIVLGVHAMTFLHVFDGFHVPWQIILAYGLIFVALIMCAWTLRLVSQRIRQHTIWHFEARQLEGEGVGTDSLVERSLLYVEGMIHGAFSPFLAHPLLRAALLPFAGLGGLSLLNMGSVSVSG